MVLAVVVTPASVQDRDGARALLWRLRARCRRLQLVWADAGYAVFEVLPRRWVVERTFAWISKHRRCVRDYERLPEHHEAVIKWAMIALMTRRLARHTPRPSRPRPSPWQQPHDPGNRASSDPVARADPGGSG
jgi:transposase